MTIEREKASPYTGRRALLSLLADLARFAGRRGVLALAYIAAGAVFESIGLILLIPLFGLVIGNRGGNGLLARVMSRLFQATGIGTPFGRLSLLLFVFSVLVVVRGVVVSRRDNTAAALRMDFIDDLRSQIAAALASSGWDQVMRLRHARIMNLLSGEIQRVGAVTAFLLQASIAVVMLFAQSILSFVLAPGLALFALALLIAGGIAMIPVLRRARVLGRFVSDANLSMLDTTAQFLSGLKLAHSQNLQSGFVSEFQATLNGLMNRQLRYLKQQTAGRVALTTISALVGAAVILVGYGVLDISAPVLIAFLLVIARMSGPASQLQQGFQQLAHGLPAYEAIVTLLAELRGGTKPAGLAVRDAPQGAITFEAASFQHPHTDDMAAHGVRDVSLRILPQSFVGIAGPSGAGKTTLADLLVGLLQPQAGRISVGGAPLDASIMAGWRAQLSYISQDPFLFHDSVRRNLLWARPEASEQEMWDAMALTGADQIVRRMAGGLDAIVGERGSLVSGGERQRIALARALLRRPKLLVMDEATNAIDVDGERSLIERLLAIRPCPTIVMIAHRAEVLALCDRVLHMENGRLIAEVPSPGQPAG